jgi:hypothetical protein
MTRMLLINDIHFNNSRKIKVDGRLSLQILIKNGAQKGYNANSLLLMW